MGPKKIPAVLAGLLASGMTSAYAGEADIKLPDLETVQFFGGSLSSHAILYFGLAVCVVGALFGFFQYKQTCGLPVHRSMADVSNIIWETCKTYLLQQG
jgi:K(+)-stimulated pyrophosphate-energized sodium pump